MKCLATLLDRFINRIYPMNLTPPFDHADWLADVEADHETWDGFVTHRDCPICCTNVSEQDEPLAEWERELIETVERSHKEKAVGAIAAAILRGHDVIGAPIYADQIAQALLDNFTITPKEKGGINNA